MLHSLELNKQEFVFMIERLLCYWCLQATESVNGSWPVMKCTPLYFIDCESARSWIHNKKCFQDSRSCMDLIRKTINILDERCMLSLEVVKLDQKCLQLYFDEPDTQLLRHELLSSGALACFRAGNEHITKVTKRSRTIQQGISTANFDLKRLDNTCVDWRFQVNSMHKQCVSCFC